MKSLAHVDPSCLISALEARVLQGEKHSSRQLGIKPETLIQEETYLESRESGAGSRESG